MLKLLLIEDDKSFNDTVRFFLSGEGFEADGAACAEEAFRKMETTKYDLVITDVMLPSVDGFEIAKLLRLYDPQLPIIFLTALDDLRAKEKGYAAGIDDYLTKPVSLNELLWHVKALLRRAGLNRQQKLTAGNLTLDTRSLTASCYAASVRSRPASALTSMISVDSGRWKFVIRQSRILKRYPG